MADIFPGPGHPQLEGRVQRFERLRQRHRALSDAIRAALKETTADELVEFVRALDADRGTPGPR